jgi:leucyl aminopeptidase
MPHFTVEAARLTPQSPKKTVVVFAENKAKLTESAQVVDAALGGFIRNALKQGRFQGGAGEVVRFTVGGGAISQVLVMGVGKLHDTRRNWWKAGLILGKQLDALGVKDATVALGELDGDTLGCAEALIEGVGMALYRFDGFKTEMKDHMLPRFEKLTILTSTRTARELEERAPAIMKLLDAIETTRDAVNTPPNIANPQFMADAAKKLEKLGIKVDVFDEKQLKKMGCNLMLAVGGSAAPEDQPRLVVMHYNGAAKTAPTHAIVGKGVMFDTGGYNIKPGQSMRGMKYDMAGAAAVLGAMQALAARKAKVNVVGVMSCAMNMIGQTPFVMDSIYKSYKGLNVEIGHTDAEGRLMLADAVAYTIDKYQPVEVVDLATLTGACMVALGGGYAGLFSTKESLANALQKSGDMVGERLWPLPVDDFYTSKSEVADICNDSMSGYGGASIGAAFIKKFADKTPWAHLDIAGVANAEKIPGARSELQGATGFGVRLLVNWLEGLQESDTAVKGKRRGRKPRVGAAAPLRTTTGESVVRKRGRPPKVRS